MVLLEQIPPAPITQGRRRLRRPDEVREEDGRKHPIGCRGFACPREELANLGDHPVGIEPRNVVAPGKLDVPRTGDGSGQEACVLHVTDAILDRMDDQRRHVDRRRDVTNVDLVSHSRERFPGGLAPGPVFVLALTNLRALENEPDGALRMCGCEEHRQRPSL